jgi:hypothetical protein
MIQLSNLLHAADKQHAEYYSKSVIFFEICNTSTARKRFSEGKADTWANGGFSVTLKRI